MKVTALGAVTSDALEDMRILSGVGGQYNFVAMAHELEDARSIIMLPSTRKKEGEIESNIVWNYGHTTIPRHLRDVVVTEYGTADLRGKCDREIIESMLSITDARFQDQIISKAKSAGKLPEPWKCPEEFRKNKPSNVKTWAKNMRTESDLKKFPFGSELTAEEQVIADALRKLKQSFDLNNISLEHLTALSGTLQIEPEEKPYLERMNLLNTENWKEYVLQKVLLYALNL
jgi:hypothetical protein